MAYSFLLFPSSAFSYMFKGGRLGIGGIGLGYGSLFLMIGRSFRLNICYVHML
jgi:hypothetical protein